MLLWADDEKGAGMALNRSARTIVPAVPLSFLVTLLALAALVIGIFAIHSAATGHDLAAPLMTSASSVTAGDTSTGVGTIAAAVAAPESVLVSSSAHAGAGDGTWLALACVLLLGLAALVFWAALSTATRRLFTGTVVSRITVQALAWPIPRPSLTLLSVRRV